MGRFGEGIVGVVSSTEHAVQFAGYWAQGRCISENDIEIAEEVLTASVAKGKFPFDYLYFTGGTGSNQIISNESEDFKMIKCKNGSCPNEKVNFQGCCVACSCKDSCEDACEKDPSTCGDSIPDADNEETALGSIPRTAVDGSEFHCRFDSGEKRP